MLDKPEKSEIPLYSPHLIALMRATHEKGGVFRFMARGFSMAPFVKDGDVLTVANASAGYNLGEIVAFILPNLQKLVVHRVIDKKNNTYLIKGDNIPHGNDGWIPLPNMLGKVVRVERKGRDAFAGLGYERSLVALLSRFNLFFGAFFFPRLILRVLWKTKDE